MGQDNHLVYILITRRPASQSTGEGGVPSAPTLFSDVMEAYVYRSMCLHTLRFHSFLPREDVVGKPASLAVDARTPPIVL